MKQTKVQQNPMKCQFAIGLEVFLGHVVSKRGIKAYPNQIKAIMGMPEPLSQNEVQVLIDTISALTRFISRILDHCTPFLKVLQYKKVKNFG